MEDQRKEYRISCHNDNFVYNLHGKPEQQVNMSLPAVTAAAIPAEMQKELTNTLGIIVDSGRVNVGRLFQCIGFVDALKDGTCKATLDGLNVFVDPDARRRLSHPKHTHMFEEFINELVKENCSLHTWLKSKTVMIPGPIDNYDVLLTDCGATEETTFKQPETVSILECFAGWFDPFKRAQRNKTIPFPPNHSTLVFTEAFNAVIGYQNCKTEVETIGDNRYKVKLKFADLNNENKLEIYCDDTDNPKGASSKVTETPGLRSIVYKNLSINDFKEGNGSKTQMWKTSRINGVKMTTALKIGVVYSKSQGDNNQASTTQVYNVDKDEDKKALITTCDQVLFMIAICRKVPVGLINAIKTDQQKMHQLRLYRPETPDNDNVKKMKALYMVVSNVNDKIEKVSGHLNRINEANTYSIPAYIRKQTYNIPSIFFIKLGNALCTLMAVLQVIYNALTLSFNASPPSSSSGGQAAGEEDQQSANNNRRYRKIVGLVQALFIDCKYKLNNIPSDITQLGNACISIDDFDTVITHLLVANDAFFTKNGRNMIFSGASLFAKKASPHAFVEIKKLVNSEFANNKIIADWAQGLAVWPTPGEIKYVVNPPHANAADPMKGEDVMETPNVDVKVQSNTKEPTGFSKKKKEGG